MIFETYQPKHKEACLQIFKSNMPKYFMPYELDLFDTFLDNEGMDGSYYVAIQDENIVACGGYFFHESFDKAGLSWGMVDEKLHGQGIGKALTIHRLQKMREAFPQDICIIETSQHTFPFYQKLGFEIKKITPDGFGEGLDNYYMEWETFE